LRHPALARNAFGSLSISTGFDPSSKNEIENENRIDDFYFDDDGDGDCKTIRAVAVCEQQQQRGQR